MSRSAHGDSTERTWSLGVDAVDFHPPVSAAVAFAMAATQAVSEAPAMSSSKAASAQVNFI
jgi:hypothetical protein